jgi:DNA-binding transcriptional LysR family regulator
MDLLFSMDVFARAVEKGGFSAVAKDLGISATMVGKHIRFLEDRLGVRLLNRTTRRQSLTDVGTLYFERCKLLLAEAAEADACVQRSRQAPRGVLRVVSPVTFGVQRLVPALAGFLEQYQEISVELTLNDRTLDFIEEGYEAAIRIGKLEDSSLIARPMQPYCSTICASPAYLAKHGTPKKPSDLSRHNCLGFAYWDRRSAWRLTGPDGTTHTVRIQGNLTVNQGQALRFAALAGVGIVMQPEILFSEDIAAGLLVRVLTKYSPPARPMHLVYLPDRQMTPKLRSFVNFMMQRFGVANES